MSPTPPTAVHAISAQSSASGGTSSSQVVSGSTEDSSGMLLLFVYYVLCVLKENGIDNTSLLFMLCDVAVLKHYYYTLQIHVSCAFYALPIIFHSFI